MHASDSIKGRAVARVGECQAHTKLLFDVYHAERRRPFAAARLGSTSPQRGSSRPNGVLYYAMAQELQAM